ncbi:electron transport complex protein RnfABCDGE type D subunit [Mycoplasma sp. CAG:956]|nr:electron transport complex protein RnfABCDGE type D subunit [Mycoplasma sp. CAG:956]
MPSYLTRKTSNKFYEGLLLLILLPIIGFSLYKYGYLDYSKGLVSLFASFKVLWLLLINIIITFISSNLLKDNYPYKYYETIVLTLLLPIRIPYIIDIIGVLVYNLIRKYLYTYHLNNIAISKLLITVCLMILNKNNYLSFYQEQVSSLYTTSDLIWGASIGSIGSNNLVILILCYLLLCNVIIYKKDIPWYAILGYTMTLGIYGLINNNLIYLMKLTLNSTVLFSIIFVSSINISSPVGRKLRRIYGLLVGILSFAFLTINPYDAGLIGIIMANLIINLIEYSYR